MKDNDEELLFREIEYSLDGSCDALLEDLTTEISAVTARLNRLRPMLRTRRITDSEGEYFHLEVHRLQCQLNDLNEIYKNLHNWSLESVFNLNRSDYGELF
jgi:hypothetical protein